MRCPNGSRKNKLGDCIKKDLLNNTIKRKKSSNERKISEKDPSERKSSERKISEKEPSERKISEKEPSERKSGERKSSERKISEKEPSERKSSERKSSEKEPSERKSSETKTPRSIYAKRYFADNKKTIYLLDSYGKNAKSVMVQVNYNDVEQFTNYQNLSSRPSNDCFFQTIFSLGLRDVKMAKKDSMDANSYNGTGVHIVEILLFIKNAFNLSKREKVYYKCVNLEYDVVERKLSRNEINNKIVKIFNSKLKNGYAAPIYIERYYKSSGRRMGHSLVVYKYNDIIYFFDPQIKGYMPEWRKYNSTNIYEVSESDITKISYYTVSNLKNPKPLMDTTCQIK